MGERSRYFRPEEFACRCGCGEADVSPALVSQLDSLRAAYGKPITITSGVRCERHNAACGGKAESAHLKGLAADIKVNSSQERYELLGTIFRLRLFDRIGVGNTFIHVDCDGEKPCEVVWVY